MVWVCNGKDKADGIRKVFEVDIASVVGRDRARLEQRQRVEKVMLRKGLQCEEVVLVVVGEINPWQKVCVV